MSQIEYCKKLGIPWGISESAYNELDNSLNYKYKAFSTPYLKAKEDKENRIVLSPYASLMALELYPEEVYDNMQKFKDLEMYGKYKAKISLDIMKKLENKKNGKCDDRASQGGQPHNHRA